MAIIHIRFEDTEEGVKVNFISDTIISDNIAEWTGAQMLARQTSEAIDMLMQEKSHEVQTR